MNPASPDPPEARADSLPGSPATAEPEVAPSSPATAETRAATTAEPEGTPEVAPNPTPELTPELTVEQVLGPRGLLAMGTPYYEDRAGQRQMAQAVANALDNESALIVEAGTGTGKTLAYLVPALLSGKRVVVSTGTRTLQDQITRHDIPLLQELLPQPFTAVTLKGVSNYLCRRRLNDRLRLAAMHGGDESLDLIADWARHTPTGDRAEVDSLADEAPIWQQLTNTPESRLGPRCPYFESCFVTQARRRAEKADLIVVNHHLFFADRALRAAHPGARVLPDHDAVIFDEAHQLEDVMTEHFGVQVSTVRLAQLTRDARAVLVGPGDPLFATASSSPVAGSSSAGPSARHTTSYSTGRILDHVDRCAVTFFARVRQHLHDGAPPEPGRIALDSTLFADASREEAWLQLDTALEELAAHAALHADALSGQGDDDRAEDTAAIARRAGQLRDDIATLAEQSATAFVYWGELRSIAVNLCAAPVDVSEYMRRHVLADIPAAVLTSATLRTAGDFGYVRRRLGLDNELAATLAVESSFDYRRQVVLYLPQDLPDPRTPGFAAASCQRIAELVAITDGSAFVLFTSHRALREAARRLAGMLTQPVLVQGSMPRGALLDRFAHQRGAVLLGTGAFWEGVDVPGDALSLVIIDKLPFAAHTDPLMHARMRRIESEQGDPFVDYQLPQAALALKQGFGRLIRRSDDRGIVALLDGRVLGRNYGRVFLETLPGALTRTSAIEQVRRWWQAQQVLPAAESIGQGGSDAVGCSHE